MRKIKLGHEEVELRLFLEVLGVYAILALTLAGVYYMEPLITGFVTVEKQLNYTDYVNFTSDENDIFVWELANPGNLKSVKIDGVLVGNGSVKVYIEHEGERHLVLDSSMLVEGPTGLYGITGFAVKAKSKDEIKTEKKGTLDEGQRELFDLLIADINATKNNVQVEIETDDGEVSKKLNGTITQAQDELIGNLSSSLMNSAENIKIRIVSEFGESGGQEEVEAPINETLTANETRPENETAINQTTEKLINIHLEYGGNEAYDANNDGIETISGVIDFDVENTEFNWGADESKLCTRYEIFSTDGGDSELACYGSSDCCSLVGLESSREMWDDGLFLSYGSYGGTKSNIVFAQVLYANYSLSADNPHSDIAYSSWGNATAEFVEGIEFDNVCADSCTFDGNAGSYKFIVEAGGTEIRISRINYVIVESVANNAPELLKEIDDITITKNMEHSLNLKEYFSDIDYDGLSYSYSADNISIIFEKDTARVIPDRNFTGTRFVYITAGDSYDTYSSNTFMVKVVETKIELLDAQKGDNITVSFRTFGMNNLTIRAMGSYGEFFNDNITTEDSLEIVELRCGDFEIFDRNGLIGTDSLGFILQNESRFAMIDLLKESAQLESLFAEGYSCEDTSYLTARAISGSDWAQKISFGNETIIADAVDIALTNTFEIRDAHDSKLAVFDSFGNLNIKGNLTENASMTNDGNDFMIQSPEGVISFLITNPEGNMLISGFLNQNQSALAPGINSFVVQNNLGETVAYVDKDGEVLLKGFFGENRIWG